MAELIPRERLNKQLAHMEGVRKAVEKYAERAAKRARARLNTAKGRTGHSRIELDKHQVDILIVLHDPPSRNKDGSMNPGNAMAIEFGHNIVRGGNVIGYAKGLNILRRATAPPSKRGKKK